MINNYSKGLKGLKFTIHQGDNRDTLKNIDDNSIDAIVTDPPYGIDFLGKTWDANTGALETYTECLRVLKPGGYILAFSAARTYHHLAITLEQAGFEIRDQLMWLYSSGFPKAQDIGKAIQRRQGVEETKEYKHNVPVNGGAGETKHYENSGEIVPTSPEAQQWAGWKTALKPAHEPICMARKPFKGSTIDNVLQHGVGALNIDATRIEYDGPNDKPVPHGGKARQHKDNPGWMADNTGYKIIEDPEINPNGRFPSNVIGEVEGYQKFFYCPKVSRKERHCGFEQKNIPTSTGGMYDNHGTGKMYSIGTDMKSKKHDPLGHIPKHFQTENRMETLANDPSKRLKTAEAETANVGNNHPTVKPVELMKYLIKLVTPKNSTVLDPFTGSGSTGMAAVELGHTFVGCELDPNYVKIAETRIEAWNRKDESEQLFESLFEYD